MNDRQQSELRLVATAYADGDRQCDARALADQAPHPLSSGRPGPRCVDRAWIAAVVVATTYDDAGHPGESELARRYGCPSHVREALEWAWWTAAEYEHGRVVVEQHERVGRSGQARMPPERWGERYVPGLPDDPEWRP
jgi:hypothetical protein